MERIAQFNPFDDKHVADRILARSDKLGASQCSGAMEHSQQYTHMGTSNRSGGINGNDNQFRMGNA
jgi:hypothetical protein